MGMQTPDQRVEELELFLKNFDTTGFSVEDFINVFCIINNFGTGIGIKLRSAHAGCCCNDL